MTTTRWWKYLSELMGEDTATNAAKKTGISASNFTRWKQGANADPEFVVKVARAYHANVLEALVAADVISEEEAGIGKNSTNELYELTQTMVHSSKMVEFASSVLGETVLKIQAAYASDVLGERITSADDSLSKKFHEALETPRKPGLHVVSTPADINDTEDDGTVADFDWTEPHAADSSPSETQARLERGEDPID